MSESDGEKVQYFELFFDLVYVFTLIQITRTIVDDGTLEGIVHGLFVLVLVWWVWVAFTSMANVGLPAQDTRDWRKPLFAVAMAILLLVALSIPRAFWDNSKLFAKCIYIRQYSRLKVTNFTFIGITHINYNSLRIINIFIKLTGT